jgi:DNA-binding NtrC family response regulator/pSer/pThr/pTyr-binding forkhead associated (FHA) protein
MNEENKLQKRNVAAFLILKEGKTILKTYKVFSDDLIITIGRHGDNTIRLKDDRNMISRSHAAIIKMVAEKNDRSREAEKGKKEPPQFFIRDLASGHGTRVNGRFVRKKLLEEGDLIRIADYVIEFSRKDIDKRSRGRTIDQDNTFGSSDPDAVTKLSPAVTRRGAGLTDAQKEVIFSFAERGLGVDPTESPREFGEVLLKALPAHRALIGAYDGDLIHIKYHKGYEREDPDDIGKEFLDKLRETGSSLTGPQVWVQLSKDHFLGLQREQPPPFDNQDLSFLVEIIELLKSPKSKKDELKTSTPWPVTVIGLNKEVRKCVEIASEEELKNRDILLLGETGTGKEVLARFIHEQSGKTRNGPFIAVNLSSLPEGMIHSQLFGHEKGAFTDAKEAKEGYFVIAEGGTLFIDEIGDLPISVQVSLLSAMESREALKLAGRKPDSFTCRIIAATNRDIEKKIEAGEFRSDLLARFTHIIRLPPLRKRLEELPLLMNYFIDQFSEDPKGISREAMQLLRQYFWPENVREVRKVVLRALQTAQDTIYSWDLPEEVRFQKQVQETVKKEKKRLQSLDQGIKEMIEEVLAATHGNVTKALEILKIPKSTLYKMMKDMGIPVGYGRKT